jgi:ribosome-binding protein aMBF1 (putative translation factor)/phage-related protein
MPAIKVVFYQENDGRVPLLEWLDNLKPPKGVAKCRVLMELLKQHGQDLRRPHADYLRDEIDELRAKLGRVRYRMLYFFHGRGVAVISHGFAKPKAQVDPKEIDKAVERKERFRADPQPAHLRGEPIMTKAKKPATTDAVAILHGRYFKGNPAMLALLEEERHKADIAQKIYDLRTKAGLTQRQLATRVGTTASVICRLEDADYEGHSLDMLRRIAAVLDYTVEVRFVPARRKRPVELKTKRKKEPA